MKGYFITGTDTGVGKTIVSSVLMSLVEGIYWKPIQSGLAVDPLESDIVKMLSGKSAVHATQYLLQASLSPDQAANLENIKIDIENLSRPDPSHTVIMEGAGGVLVPLNSRHRIIDLIERMAIPAIIVARGTLGTINHTLLTIDALKQRHIPIKGIVYNGEINIENVKAIEYWSGIKTLFHLPHIPQLQHTTLKQWVDENQKHLREALCF